MTLRERFAELREEERDVAPQFRVARKRQSFVALRWAVACLLLVIIAALFPRHHVTFTADDRAAAREITRWQSPTDFLLTTPGHEVLSTIPSIPSEGVSR